MKWLEANPLPAECQNCQEEDCDNCDHAGDRWYLSKEDELLIRREGLLKAIDRLQRQIESIDRELLHCNTQVSMTSEEYVSKYCKD